MEIQNQTPSRIVINVEANPNIKNLTVKKSFKDSKLYKLAVGVSIGAVIIASGKIGYNFAEYKELSNPSVMNSDSIIISIEENLQSGDSLYSLAQLYYSDEISNFYGSLEKYVSAIQKQNGIESYQVDNLPVGKSITLPVIIDKNNEIYYQTLLLENELINLKKYNEWVDNYPIGAYQTVWGIADSICINDRDIPEVVEKICKKNGIGGISPEMDYLTVPNPEIFQKELELEQAEDMLKSSLQEQYQNKK